MTIKLFNFINKKIEYHFIKNIEKGRRPAILKSINKNNTLKLILLDIIIEFLNVLNSEKIKIRDIRVNEWNKKYINQEKIFIWL